jgi:hypothetical protein
MELLRNESIVLVDFSFNIYDVAKLPLIAVYEHPKDWPDKYVARLWDVVKKPHPTRYMVLGEHLKEIRDKIPQSMSLITRFVEAWI